MITMKPNHIHFFTSDRMEAEKMKCVDVDDIKEIVQETKLESQPPEFPVRFWIETHKNSYNFIVSSKEKVAYWINGLKKMCYNGVS